MKLKIWLLEQGMTITTMAEKLGIARVYLHNLIVGKGSPSKKLLHRIQELTSRKVFTKEDILWQKKGNAKQAQDHHPRSSRDKASH